MRATISRQYREGNWSVYSEDIGHLWEDFIFNCPFEFDKDNESHRTYANGYVQAKFGKDARINIDWA
jgi:hypothetical protein